MIGKADAAAKAATAELDALKAEAKSRGRDLLIGDGFEISIKEQIAGRADVAALKAHLGAAVSLPRAAGAAQTASSAPALWLGYLRARGALTAASQRYSEATARLPWWAKFGPSLLGHDSRHCGVIAGWPAMQDVGLTDQGAFRVIRPGRADIEKDYRFSTDAFGGEATARAHRDRRLAELGERIEAQNAERAKVGLPGIDVQYDHAADVAIDAGEAIRAAAPYAPDAIAARIIVAIIEDCGVRDTVEDCGGMGIAAIALAGLLPQLTGDLATDAAEIVQHPSRELRAMRCSLGIDASGATLPFVANDGREA